MNSTQDPTRVMEDTLRCAMHTAAETVQRERIRELRDPRPARPASRARTAVARVAIPLSAAAAIALIAVLSSVFAAGPSRGHPLGATTPGAAAPARFFLAGYGNGDGLAVFSAVTGKLVAPVQPPQRDTVITVAASTGNDSTFLIADEGATCSTTKLYQLTLTSRGEPNGLTPLAIHAISGVVTALSASADGSTIGYATQFCSKISSSPGAIGVIHVNTGQSAQWSIPAPGQSVTTLSITANGRMIAFAGAPNKVTGPTEGQILPVRTIRLLPADAPPGTADQRSRAVVTISRLSPAGIFDSAIVGSDGRTLYFCTRSAPNHSDSMALRSYDVATGAISVLRYFGGGATVCALGESGPYLLAGTGQDSSSLIRYDTTTGRSVPVPVQGKWEWEEVTGTIPW